MKRSITAAVTISLLVIASATAYGLFTIDSVMTAKPNQQVQVTNYSAEIDTLKPQINSLSNNITSLSAVKSDITDIKGKITELETKLTQAQQDALSSQKPVMLLDRSSYFQGDTIHITAIGVDPQATVNIQLVDSSGFVAMHRDTSSDSSGRLSFDFPLSLTIPSGSYDIKLIAGQKLVSQPITIMSSGITLSNLYQFTAHTSQDVYLAGNLFEIYGIGAPNTVVNSILTSPSGRTLTSHTTIQPDGTYDLFFTDSSHETGNWQFAVSNQGIEKTSFFTVTPNPPATQYSFTAQAFSTIYKVGNLIQVSGTAVPFTLVNAVLTSPSGLTYDTSTTTSSSGSYIVSFSTAQWYETGIWNITLTNQGKSRQVSIFMESSNTSNNSNPFVVQTDKTIYRKGDQVKISGDAEPFTSVTSVMTSPSGDKFNGATVTNFDGSYNINYLTSPSFESGNWYITLHNGILTQVVSIYLEP